MARQRILIVAVPSPLRKRKFADLASRRKLSLFSSPPPSPPPSRVIHPYSSLFVLLFVITHPPDFQLDSLEGNSERGRGEKGFSDLRTFTSPRLEENLGAIVLESKQSWRVSSPAYEGRRCVEGTHNRSSAAFVPQLFRERRGGGRWQPIGATHRALFPPPSPLPPLPSPRILPNSV